MDFVPGWSSFVTYEMTRGFNFVLSKAQYVRKFKQWQLEKNFTNDKWRFVAGQIQKRKLAGKDSEILINGKTIPSKKVRKETTRYSLLSYSERPEMSNAS